MDRDYPRKANSTGTACMGFAGEHQKGIHLSHKNRDSARMKKNKKGNYRGIERNKSKNITEVFSISVALPLHCPAELR